MRTYLDCLPCFLRQALDAARRATRDAEIQREVLNRVASVLPPELPLDATPIEIGGEIRRVVREATGGDDVLDLAAGLEAGIGRIVFRSQRGSPGSGIRGNRDRSAEGLTRTKGAGRGDRR